MIQEFENIPKVRNAFFIQVSFTDVKEVCKREARDWLNQYGDVLMKIGNNELVQIKEEIERFREKLKSE